MKLFLDDNRDPPDDTWLVVRTADEAIAAIKGTMCSMHGRHCPDAEPFEAMMFDHDLGHCGNCEGCEGWKDPCGCRCHLTGYVVAVWMETEDIWPEKKPTCHSRNPVGKSKIEAAINRKYDK
jgi:hypothetical protein